MKKQTHWLLIALVVVALGGASHTAFSDDQQTARFGLFLAGSDSLIFSGEHIASYDWSRHEIELNASGAKRWESMVVYNDAVTPRAPVLDGLYGKEFVVKVLGEEIYRGRFWSYASSTSYDGIVLLDVLCVQDCRLQLQVGYPSPPAGNDLDPRDDAKLLSYLKSEGLLAIPQSNDIGNH